MFHKITRHARLIMIERRIIAFGENAYRLSDAARCLTVKSIAVFEYKIGKEYIDVIGAPEKRTERLSVIYKRRRFLLVERTARLRRRERLSKRTRRSY